MFREKIRLEKEHASKQAISEFVNAFNQSSQKENEVSIQEYNMKSISALY